MRKIIEGNVDLSYLYLIELFDLSDVEVMGYFNCSKNDLTSLVGAPHIVTGDFDCRYNDLMCIKDIPKVINGRCIMNEELIKKFTKKYIRSLSDIQGEIVSSRFGFYFPQDHE